MIFLIVQGVRCPKWAVQGWDQGPQGFFSWRLWERVLPRVPAFGGYIFSPWPTSHCRFLSASIILLCSTHLDPVSPSYKDSWNDIEPLQVNPEASPQLQLLLLNLITFAKSLCLFVCHVERHRFHGLGCGHLRDPLFSLFQPTEGETLHHYEILPIQKALTWHSSPPWPLQQIKDTVGSLMAYVI